MGLSNEIYVVHTAAKGDVVVGIGEYVVYDKVTLVGYNAYNYHSYISQSLVNLNDAINLLKGGTAAQASAELEEAVTAAKKVITDEVAKINTAIVGLIEENLAQTISETKLENTNITISVSNVTTVANKATTDIAALTPRVTAVEAILEDPKTKNGLIKDVKDHLSRLNIIDTTIGYSATNNSAGTGIINDVDILKTNVSVIPTHTTQIKTLSDVIGNAYNSSTTTLSSDLIAVKNILFKSATVPTTYTGRGIYQDIYDSSNGIIVRLDGLNTVMTSIQALDSSASTAATSISTLSSDVFNLKSKASNIESIVGIDDSAGLRKRVSDIEGLGINNVLTNHTTTLSTLNATVGNASSGLVKQVETNKNNISNLTSYQGTLKTRLDAIDPIIISIDTNLTTLNTFASNINATIDTHYTISGKIYNAAKLKTIDETVDTLVSNDRSSQFDTYFKKNGLFINESLLGLPAIQAWVASSASDGMKNLTDDFIEIYLNNDTKYNKIVNLESRINTINGDASVTGSTVKKINTALDAFKTANIDPITLTNTAQTNSITSLNNALTAHDTRITNLESSDVAINKKIEEINNETVKYSVFLPFIKRMVLMSRDVNQTDEMIAEVFDKIMNNIANLSTTYSNNGTVTLVKASGQLTYLVTGINITSINYDNYIDNTEYTCRLRYYDGSRMFVLPLVIGVPTQIVNGSITLTDLNKFYEVDLANDDLSVLTTLKLPAVNMTLNEVLIDMVGKIDANLTFDVIVGPANGIDGYESYKISMI